MVISDGPVYFSVESPFVRYIERCLSIGMTHSEIKKNFPYLEKYYKEMVIDVLGPSTVARSEPSLEKLFNEIMY